jgi:hypothetical protein
MAQCQCHCRRYSLDSLLTADSHQIAPGIFTRVALKRGTKIGPRSATAADCIMDSPARTRPISSGGAASVIRAWSEGPAGAPKEPTTVADEVWLVYMWQELFDKVRTE